MSTPRNFRVNVNLSNFFNDHRHTVRLFVNDNIETIEDLKQKIGSIFGLQDFHLSCQNEYLPPSEDVRILQKDELLWAMPDKSEKSLEGKSILSFEGSSTIKPSKGAKRSISAPEEYIEEELSRPKKKKKKHTKERYEKHEISNIKTLLPVLHSHINSYNERNGNSLKTDKNMDIDGTKEVVCKGNLQNYKKKVPLPTVTEEYLKKKKINIVKIDYVLDDPKTKKKDNECVEKEPVIDKSTSTVNTSLRKVATPTETMNFRRASELQNETATSDSCGKLQDKPDTSQEIRNLVPPSRGRRFFFTPPSYKSADCRQKNENSHPKYFNIEEISKSEFQEANKIPQSTDTTKSSFNLVETVFFTDVKQVTTEDPTMNNTSDQNKIVLDMNGQLLGDLRNSDSASYIDKTGDSEVQFISHKRRRHRNRSKKSSNNVIAPVIKIEQFPKPIKVEACPTMHLKFVENEHSDHVVVVDMSDVKKADVENKPLVSEMETWNMDDDVENFEIRDEKVKEYPPMGDSLPKCGDVIIFKKLKMTENYCPEVSSWITGRVKAFDPQNKNTTFDIVVGLDQCEEPQGKLSVDTKEDHCQQHSVREILWHDVMEPRLLYP